MCHKNLIFLFFNQNICFRYWKEPSQWDGSFEHPKHMSKLMIKKIITILRKSFLLDWPYEVYAHLNSRNGQGNNYSRKDSYKCKVHVAVTTNYVYWLEWSTVCIPATRDIGPVKEMFLSLNWAKSVKVYVLGAKKNRLIETVLFSTHNINFWLRNKKYTLLIGDPMRLDVLSYNCLHVWCIKQIMFWVHVHVLINFARVSPPPRPSLRV